MPLQYLPSCLLFLAPVTSSPLIPRLTRKLLFSLGIWKPLADRNNFTKTLREFLKRHRENNIRLGLLNTRSAVNKAALLHDSINDNNLDILALTETWISSDLPNCIKLDVAPPGFSVQHYHRPNRRGGGLSIIYISFFKSVLLDLGPFSEFESLSLKLTNFNSSFIISVLYRPPGPINQIFLDQLSFLVDSLLSSTLPFFSCWRL